MEYMGFGLKLINMNLRVNIMEKFLILGLLAVLLLSPLYAQIPEYYADVQLKVMPAGEVEISGTTNHPSLAPGTTQKFTSKNGENWLLNITLPDNFSEYVYDVSFPPNAQINFMNVPKNVRMETQGDAIHIIATGTNQTFFAVVQYSFDGSAPPPLPQDILIALGIIIAIVIFAAAVIYLYRRQKKGKKATYPSAHKEIEHAFKKIPAPKETKQRYNPVLFTDRQNQILEMIEREGGHTTQAKIQAETKIPKASLSRNIESLVRKNVIKKERKGMTMVIYFSEE
jgi:uncharacterized membrane protein